MIKIFKLTALILLGLLDVNCKTYNEATFLQMTWKELTTSLNGTIQLQTLFSEPLSKQQVGLDLVYHQTDEWQTLMWFFHGPHLMDLFNLKMHIPTVTVFHMTLSRIGNDFFIRRKMVSQLSSSKEVSKSAVLISQPMRSTLKSEIKLKTLFSHGVLTLDCLTIFQHIMDWTKARNFFNYGHLIHQSPVAFQLQHQ